MTDDCPQADDELLVRRHRIEQLWRELEETKFGSYAYNALIERIRQETAAYRQVLAQKDPDTPSPPSNDPRR